MHSVLKIVSPPWQQQAGASNTGTVNIFIKPTNPSIKSCASLWWTPGHRFCYGCSQAHEKQNGLMRPASLEAGPCFTMELPRVREIELEWLSLYPPAQILYAGFFPRYMRVEVGSNKIMSNHQMLQVYITYTHQHSTLKHVFHRV